MLPAIARLVDDVISRGEGLDARGDPFGPPLDAATCARTLEAIRAARFDGPLIPARSPLAPPGGSDEVHVLLQRPREGNRWALFLPPYGAYDARGQPGLYAIHSRTLSRAGFGVAAVSLPYHGRRALAGKPSGYGFVRADLGVTALALASAAAEVVALARHLREHEGAEQVAGLGISLGGAALGLASALGAPVDAAAFLAAVDNCASFYYTGKNRAARRATLAAAGYDQARVAEAFQPFAPSTYAAPVRGERLVFAIPPEDRVVPAEAQERWRDAWHGHGVRLRGHGHATAIASPFVAARLARELAARLA